MNSRRRVNSNVGLLSMTKKSRIVIAVGVVIFCVAGIGVLAVVLIGAAFEPIDPFPRADLTATCQNKSSVVFYQRKISWFTEETEWSVKQFDEHGKLIRRQVLFTLAHWNDSEMHRKPDEFCDDTYWPRAKILVPWTQPNKSLQVSAG